MNCSNCGTQLPPGAAACPMCGTPTPQYGFGSGATPYDATVASPYNASPPTAYGSQPYSAPPPPQYGAPPPPQYTFPQPPPPAGRSQGKRIGIIVGVGLLLLILLGAGLF